MNDWFEAELRVERAQQLAEAQRWADALVELEAALEINPHNAAWHAHHAFLLEQLGRPADSLRAYEKALEIDPDDSDIRFAMGGALMALGRYARAVEVYTALAAEHPNDERVYCHRIAAYAELGLHDLAEEMFYLAQQIDEDCPHCFFHVGASLAARGMTARAIACWKRVLELDPEYAGVSARIGRAYRQQREFDLAREFYLAELRCNAGDTDLLFEMAELAVAAGQPASARNKLQQIIELDPEHGGAFFMLGQICVQNRQYEKALQCFETAAVLGESPPALELLRGEAALHLGRFDEARKLLEVAVEQTPGEARAHVALGDALLHLERYPQALESFLRAASIQPATAQIHYRIAICNIRLGRFEPALRRCVETIRLDPKHIGALQDAAVINMHLRRWRQARMILDRALQVEPKSETLRHLRSRLWLYRIARLLRIRPAKVAPVSSQA
ncbi:MAG: tetratricopeptide repeat protein [Phycisphaerales bacterium]|nr:MAG: tetratricopeptide repeat protein [Phycisphaerales bacterium]